MTAAALRLPMLGTVIIVWTLAGLLGVVLCTQDATSGDSPASVRWWPSSMSVAV